MKHQRTFANTPSAVSRARHFVGRQLGDAPADVVDKVAIMVSGLATNCVRHTVTDFTVAVELSRGEIHVEVTDSGGGMPALRRPEPSEPSGRGLRIVHELADSFGIAGLSGAPGKTVWFVVAVDDASIEPPARASHGARTGTSSESAPAPREPEHQRIHEPDDTTRSPDACGRRRTQQGRRDDRRPRRPGSAPVSLVGAPGATGRRGVRLATRVP